MLISLIVTTYNRPDALKLILQALNEQSDQNFEVIIGDDGSGEETVQLIKQLQAEVTYPLIHAWQKDQGFRLARVRNLAALKSHGDYLIFLDGDCIPRRNFIEVHRKLMQPKSIVAGNRVLLSQTYTETVLKQQKRIEFNSFPEWIKLYFEGCIKRIFPLINLRGYTSVLRQKNSWKKLRGCNFALFRKDFFNINGCDSSFEGWGYEDSDLAIRLIHNGIQIKSGRYASAVLHLFHKENDRSLQRENLQRLQERINSDQIKAADGLIELENELKRKEQA